ncbi:ribonuclease H-like domain-containing protein [Turneriella parva]|uniref:YprB ribonuclease H-like domain-containing protein n=1 Tax=Turneriella parva (strain ATCC BAA-1111 / DSM 21527 / NCTC 11395 / H) TaxID=869212 RepID=I4BB65_TURPD|nr:ribonuclease H-like domain-containing protein [Turneriella parva]AFM14522.1 hypothetical protein Turpa_3888 [Turneriella parva DSM 21527]
MTHDSLKARLNAYRSPAKPAPASAREQSVSPTAFELHESLHTLHPLSRTSLSLPQQVAVDFATDIDSSELLFFDLESTGLGSGEETYPFLIGAAGVNESETRLRLLFAPSPFEEADILKTFITLARQKTLVTFNGKSFDWPLVARRAQRYGILTQGAGERHIDLYHLIRRIYPEKPARLMDAEARLLGFTREGDVRGAEVAQAYFEYLHLGQSDLKEKIIHHNSIDVLSLVSLMKMVSDVFVAAREGVTGWAYKVHRHKSATPDDARVLLLARGLENLDARDLDLLSETYRKEKHYHAAARLALKSYRKGHAAAVVKAVKNLRRLNGKHASVRRIVRHALAREDERVQRQLLPYTED